MAFRTQKISQMTPKGANLEATDLIEVSTIESGSYVTRSITGQEIIDAAVGNVDWGDIGGTLSAQTDLQSALNAKENTITAGTTSQYFRGDKTFQTLDKAAVGLGNVDNTSDANKPISTATQTALNAKQNTLSLTTTGDNGASTLVGSTLNVPNYTLSGLGGVPTSRTLTINGVTQDLSANRTFTISTGITIGSTAIASGTVGRVLFEGTGNVVSESANLFWDNTNGRLGIGGTPGAFTLDVNGTARTSQLHTFSQGTYLDALTTSSFHSVDTGTGTYGGVSLKNSINNYNGLIYTGRSGASNSIVFEHTTYSGTPSANGSQIFSQTSTTFGKFNNGTYGHTLYIHQRLGSAISYPLVISNGINSTNSGVGILMQTSDSTGAATINHASITSVKQNLATSTVTSDLRFSTITDSANTLSEKMRISNSGNLLINTTTDAGFRLDVNGTARIVTSLVVGGTGSGSLTTSVVRCNYLNTSDNGYSVMQLQTLTGNATFFQGVSIGSGANPLASAQLEVTSTTKGFLPPRMTTTQKNAIATPAAGLVVYDTTLNKLCVYTTAWETVTSL